MRRRIREEWTGYLERIMPADAGRAQIEETKKAFYAGAGVVFGLLTGELTPGPDPQPEDLQRLDDLQAEFNEYIEDLKKQPWPA